MARVLVVAPRDIIGGAPQSVSAGYANVTCGVGVLTPTGGETSIALSSAHLTTKPLLLWLSGDQIVVLSASRSPLIAIPTLTDAETLFNSTWERDGTGNSDTAVGDDGYWTVVDNYNWPPKLLTVVDDTGLSTPGEHNSLRVQQHPSNNENWAYVAHSNYWDPDYDPTTDTPRDVAERLYFRSDDPEATHEDHFWHNSIAGYTSTWAIGKGHNGSDAFRLKLWTEANPGSNQDIWFTDDGAYGLSCGVWYRIELLFKFNSTSQFRIWPRIYNAAGTLIKDASDWVDWTSTYDLETWYGSNWNTFNDNVYENWCGRYDYGTFNCRLICNNGQANQAATGDYWYYSSYRIVDATNINPADSVWVGAV